MAISDQLREAIEAASRKTTLYRIAKDSGVDWGAIQRFVTGERPELRTSTVDRLCEYLGLELCPKEQHAKKAETTRKQKGNN